MVITSTTQWTIPLSSSSLSASSPPASTRQSSMLGLKTCQLSAPQRAMNTPPEPRRHSHHQDLHSTSSRRLQAAENVTSRRSAGSFRQLVPNDFFAKLGQEGPRSPVIREIGRDKEFECKYDGIAMPRGNSPLPALDGGTASVTALPGNLIGVYGDITADDVDLLPMPGLLSCSSPFITASSYVAHSQSPKTSRNGEVASSESTGSCSKWVQAIPDYLGLPPELHTGLVAENRATETAGLVNSVCHANAPPTPPITNEHISCGGSTLSSASRAHNGKEVDNFVDSLAGLWSVPTGADYTLQDSGSLASIFSIYPQNFHGCGPAADQNFFETCSNESAQCIMDGLQSLMNVSSSEGREEKVKSDVLYRFSPSRHTFSVNDLGDNIGLEAVPANGNRCAAASHPSASEVKSSVQASASDGSAISYASTLSHSRSYAESPLKRIGESISLKRPFSALDLASMASSAASTGSCITGSKPLLSSFKSMVDKRQEELNRDDVFLYESLDELKRNGDLQCQFAVKSGGNNAGGEMSPKPPPSKIRRRHGTAMDPQSVAARTRREKFSDRIRTLQSLVPNGERLDTVSMLSQTLEYVKFLQHQVWNLYNGKEPASLTDTCEKWRDFVEAGAAASAN